MGPSRVHPRVLKMLAEVTAHFERSWQLREAPQAWKKKISHPSSKRARKGSTELHGKESILLNVVPEFSKAFAKVSHSLLIAKLVRYGLD